MSVEREKLLDELAACFAQAAVDAYLNSPTGDSITTGLYSDGDGDSHNSGHTTHEHHKAGLSSASTS